MGGSWFGYLVALLLYWVANRRPPFPVYDGVLTQPIAKEGGMEIDRPFIPNIPNTHSVIETIAQNQGETTRAILKRLDKLVEQQDRQNELLAEIAKALQSRDE